MKSTAGDRMRTLTVREVTDEVYTTLRECAELNHRSLQEQVRDILAREVHLIIGARVARAQKWRRKLAGREWGNIVKDVRRERQR
jgi:plasmid stability protein